MTQTQRDLLKDFEELSKLLKAQRLVDVVALCDNSKRIFCIP